MVHGYRWYASVVYCVCGCIHFVYPDYVLKISEVNAFFNRLAAERGVDCPPPRTTARLLDKVSV